jgi:hypothetical protein
MKMKRILQAALLLAATITTNTYAQCTQPCPANATDVGFGIEINAYRINLDGSTGPAVGTGIVGQCQKIRLRMSLNYDSNGGAGGVVAAFSGGRLITTTYRGVFSQDVTPAGGVPVIAPRV